MASPRDRSADAGAPVSELAACDALEARDGSRGRKPGRLEALRSSAVFILAWVFLDVMLNLRYPGREPPYWYVIPSVDIVLLFTIFALLSRRGWHLRAWVRWGLVAWFLVVRLLRVADGVQERLYGQRFNLYSDLPLVPELVRFAYSSLAVWQFALLALGVLASLVAVVVVTVWALRCVERSLAQRRHVATAFALCAVSAAATYAANPQPHHRHLFYAGFAASAWSRLDREVTFLFNIYDERALGAQVIQRTAQRLRRTPTNLARLERANVYLFIIESYGRTVFTYPRYVDQVRSAHDSFEASLRERGFTIASTVVDSTTYGGRSWLAHATLGTGIATFDQFRYELILAKKPRSLASVFRDAGYRTVLVNPGTTRPWPKGEFYKFDQKYYSWHFDYAGPRFAWARMPDQYVLDFVRRRELTEPSGPMFLQYALVSSHAPWNEQPPLVESWSRIADGSIYQELPSVTFAFEWPDLGEQAPQAYIRSILYDLEVLRRYIHDFIADGSLVVILGDHQPIGEVNGYDRSRAVPVHVLSRNPALVERFVARGYSRGMRPAQLQAKTGLDDFPFELLAAVSTDEPRD